MKKRLLALLLTLTMVLSLAQGTNVNAFSLNAGESAVAHDHDHAEAAAAAEGTKAAKTGTVLAFTSDIHNSSDNTAKNRMDGWIDAVVNNYGGIDLFSFGGDMGTNNSSGDNFWSYTQAVMTSVETTKKLNGAYTTGNHEYSNGSFSSTSNNTATKYTIDAEVANGSNYRVYCLGSSSENQGYTYSSSDSTTNPTTQVGKLAKYLGEVGNDKPIFIITHFPLHKYSSRTTSNADKVIDALNAAALGADGEYGTSDDKLIFFLWGHNHSQRDGAYDQIYSPNYEINYSGSSKKAIKFYYAAAGCMSDSEYTGSSSVSGKGLVVSFAQTRGTDYTINLAYLDASGNELQTSDSKATVSFTGASDATAMTYTLTDTLVAGKNYIIAGEADDNGNVLMLSNVAGTAERSLEAVSWTVSDDKIVISDSDV